MQFILQLLFLFSFFTINAQDENFAPIKDLNGLKKLIKTKHANTKTIKSDFTQEKSLSFMDDKLLSKGIMKIKHEMKVRIEYTSPFAYLIVINGEKLWIKDGKKVTKINTGAGNPFSKINNILLNTLQGNFENIKGFDANYLENKKQYLLELTPTEIDTKKLFKKITVYLNHETLEIMRMDMLEKSGDITKMTFTNTEQNTPIADEVFVVR